MERRKRAWLSDQTYEQMLAVRHALPRRTDGV